MKSGKKFEEVKYTTSYIGDKLSEKWRTYVSTQDAKKKLLSSYEFMWVTEKDIGVRFYRKCLNEIKKAKSSVKQTTGMVE